MDSESSTGNSYAGRPLSSEASDSTVTSTPGYVRSVAPVGASTPQSDEDKAFDLFNLIKLSFECESVARSVVPSFYRHPQSVDAGKELGHGATFTVYRRAVPEHLPRETMVNMGGWTASQYEHKENRPAFVVFKVPRISLNERGEPDKATRHAMKSVLIEMHALTHKPLVEHPNIVDCLGLAWVSSAFDHTIRVPALTIEYADYGTLADLQAAVALTLPERFDLCTDVANGLEILHRSAIAHGDLKAENVLVFSDPRRKRRHVAKLADFGFSIVGSLSSEYSSVGGTRPWQAPEIKQPVVRHLLTATDFYSFGLLTWRVVTGISNPFTTLSPPNMSGEQLLAFAESLKQRDGFHSMVRHESWLASRRGEDSNNADQSLSTRARQSITLKVVMAALRATKCPGVSLPESGNGKDSAVVEATLGQVFDVVIDTCLQRDPTKRIMSVARNILRQRQGVPLDPRLTPAVVPQLRFNVGDTFPSWEAMTHLDADVQATVRSALRERFIFRYDKNMLQATECIMSAALSVNGQGLDVNYVTASRMLTVCAKHGHDLSQAYCYRIVKALNFPEGRPIDMSWIGRQASLGSRAAMEELAELNADMAKDYKQKNRDWKGGVGGNFYSSYNMLHDMKLTDWLAVFDDRVALIAKIAQFGGVAGIKVNKEWGDSLLHMAAACGKVEALGTLLTTYKDVLDVNVLNERSETPLFSACRAGQAATTLILLAFGADPKIAKTRGETPLHWLVSFEPQYVKDVGQLLIHRGADVSALTTDDISYSIFPPGLDYDHKPPGSPLLWAVHENRLDIVRFLLAQPEGFRLPLLKFVGRQNALEQATLFHYHECLQAMMDVLDEAHIRYHHTDLIMCAVRGANRFSMMVRNGFKWKERMTSTMTFLLDRTKNVALYLGAHQKGATVLYEAVRNYLPDMVEFLVQHGLPQMEEFHAANYDNFVTEDGGAPVDVERGAIRQAHINLARGDEGRSPLLEALRTNQRPIFDLLMRHGANPLQNANNPFSRDERNWTALHVFVHARPVYNLELIGELIRAGVPVDGVQDGGRPACETPFMVAVANNAFQAATTLIEHSCDPNALAAGHGFTELEHPTTLLGHIAAASSRNSTARLRYLLRDSPKAKEVRFVVEPARRLTALHRIAMGPSGVFARGPEITTQLELPTEDYDFAANREICYELLQYFSSRDQIDLQDSVNGMTALMMAVHHDNAEVVKLLTDNGASLDIQDRHGRSVYDIALEKQRSAVPRTTDKKTARRDVWGVLASSAPPRMLEQFRNLDLR